MTRWLLDTDVISELRRPRPSPRVVSFIRDQPLETLYLSVVTLAEVRFGIDSLPDAGKRAQLTDWLGHRVRPMFGRRVLSVDEDVILKWRVLVDEGRKAGHTFSQPELFIAATAQLHGLTVVTRDVDEYARAGTAVLNPWNSSGRA